MAGISLVDNQTGLTTAAPERGEYMNIGQVGITLIVSNDFFYTNFIITSFQFSKFGNFTERKILLVVLIV